jgi:hypothetical protein
MILELEFVLESQLTLEKTVSDDASPIELTDKLYDKFCKQGADILVRILLRLKKATSNAFSVRKESHTTES